MTISKEGKIYTRKIDEVKTIGTLGMSRECYKGFLLFLVRRLSFKMRQHDKRVQRMKIENRSCNKNLNLLSIRTYSKSRVVSNCTLSLFGSNGKTLI